MKILITNDDSIHAKGLKNLVELAVEFGEVIVVSPEQPQSAKSHSISLEKPITYKKSNIFGDNVEAYYVSGTPADCVKLAINNLLPEKPDLLLSGINHGDNTSVNLLYSGTVAGAVEGAMHDIPSLALSLASHDPEADFTGAKHYIKKVIKFALEVSNSKALCLNVNVPDIPLEEIKGIRIVKQAKGAWFEEFEKIPHPNKNANYFWLTGKYVNFEPENTDNDVWSIQNGYVSIVPLKIDFTNEVIYNEFKDYKF